MLVSRFHRIRYLRNVDQLSTFQRSVPNPAGQHSVSNFGDVDGLLGPSVNVRFLICKRTLGEAPANGRFWPKGDHRERLESTQSGHSSSLVRTSAKKSQSGRSIAANS
jgi:hypothetical protein